MKHIPIVMLIVLTVAACQSEPAPTPTPTEVVETPIVSRPTVAPTDTPALTPTRTPTTQPTPQPTATPTAATSEVWVNSVNGLNLRADSNATANVLAILTNGQHLTAIGAKVGPDSAGTSWQQVRTDDGKTGWVSAEFITTTKPGTTATTPAAPTTTATTSPVTTTTTPAATTNDVWVVATGGLNLRASSTITSNVIATLSFGQHLTAVGTKVGPDNSGISWQQVRTDSGQTGWVSAEFLTTTKPGTTPTPPASPAVTPTTSPVPTTTTPAAATSDIWVVATGGLNLRASSNTTSNAIATLSFGQHLTAIGSPTSPDSAGIVWQQVRTDASQTGWAAAVLQGTQLLSTTKPASTPTPTTTPAASNSSAIVTELLNRINALRAQNGLYAYVLNSDLSALALAHSQYMADARDVTHTGRDGTTPKQRISNAGYGSGQPTENIYGGASLGNAWTFWVNDPPHLANLLNSRNTVIGIGVVVGGFLTYFTLDFGVPVP